MKRTAVSLLSCVYVLLLFSIPTQVSACGKERWSVKTVIDKDAAKVHDAPTPATINQLRQIAAPLNPNLRPDSRYNPTELTTYEVTGYITLIKAEADQDYHIVLTDDQGRTMIAFGSRQIPFLERASNIDGECSWAPSFLETTGS